MSAEQPAVSQRSGSRVNDEDDLLRRRYGEAMVRIGELEAQLQRLGEDRSGTAGSDNAVVPVLTPDPAASLWSRGTVSCPNSGSRSPAFQTS